VECSIATEDSDCGANSCDPALHACTMTPRGSIGQCESCVADSECATDHACVPIVFGGTTNLGGFCMERLSQAPCSGSYIASGASFFATSLSGAAQTRYCGFDTTTTTCQSMRDLVDGTTCGQDSDCGEVGLADGQCEMVNENPQRCTISCQSDRVCPTGFPCGQGVCGGYVP
jgi:hypothetical protein